MKKKLLLILFIFLAGCSLTNTGDKKDSNARIEIINDGTTEITEKKDENNFSEVLNNMKNLNSFKLDVNMEISILGERHFIKQNVYVNLNQRRMILNVTDHSELFYQNWSKPITVKDVMPILITWDDETVTGTFSHWGKKYVENYDREDFVKRTNAPELFDGIKEILDDLEIFSHLCDKMTDGVCRYSFEINEKSELPKDYLDLLDLLPAGRVVLSRGIQVENGYIVKMVEAIVADEKPEFQRTIEFSMFNEVNISDPSEN